MLKPKLFKILPVSNIFLAVILLLFSIALLAAIIYFAAKITSQDLRKPVVTNNINKNNINKEKEILIATPQSSPPPQVSQKQTLPESSMAPEEELVPYTKGSSLDLRRGTLKFKITFNWTQRDKILAWLNYNGEDKKEIMEIWFGERFFAFDTYNNDEEEGDDDPNVEFIEPFGKTFDIKVAWNFIDIPYTKRIYVDGVLKKESYPKLVPSKIEGQILINKDLQDFSVSQKWEN